MPASGGFAEETSSMPLPRLQSALRQFQSSGKAFQLLDAPATTTTAAAAAAAAATGPRRCRTLIILDSSFNPPTIAHMHMATSALHDLYAQKDIAGALKGGAAASSGYGGQGQQEKDDGIRLLLLLAVNNADKAPKPASFEQRMLMMRYFAGDIQRAWRTTRARQAQQADRGQDDKGHEGHEGDVPVDIGLTTHPYFHDKSAAIASSPEYDFSPSSPSASAINTEQIVLAGYDTLIRIFNPKYYQPPVPKQGIAPAKNHDDKTPMQTSLDPFFSRARLRITMRTDADWGGREEQMRYVKGLLEGDELEQVGGRGEWARRVEMVDGMQEADGVVLSSTEARAAVKDKKWERLRRLVPEGVAGCIERGEVSW